MALPQHPEHNGGGIASTQGLPPQLYIEFSQNVNKGGAASLQ